MITPAHDKPILVTGAAGDVGGIGRNVTAMLLAKGHRVRAMVRREDARAEALRLVGPQGDRSRLAPSERIERVVGLLEDHGSIDYACAFADGLAGAALAD